MRGIARTLLLALLLSVIGLVRAQGNCGVLDPKVTFGDGSQACLTEFSFFSRKGLLTSVPDHVAYAKRYASSGYSFSFTAAPERCPFARYAAWGTEPALPTCEQRLSEASRKSAEFKNCTCDVLLESGRTKLNRAEFSSRLAAFEHFLDTGFTQDQSRRELARKREEEERIAEARRAEETRKQREAEERAAADRLAQQAVRPAPAPISIPQPQPAVQVMAHRKALVIGNDSYKHAGVLKTAREDAHAIAASLERVGYTVTLRTDLAERELKATIRNFSSQIQGGDEVTFFFAGHGIEVDNSNFLLPIDVAGESPLQIRDEAIDLKRLLGDFENRRAKFTLAIIDACRNNPFAKSGTRVVGSERGLAPTTPATGQMIIFSAGTGQLALDRLGERDTNKNGVFTRVFVQQMQRPSVSIDKIARDTRAEVVRLAQSIGHQQVPAIYDQVIGEFFFIR